MQYTTRWDTRYIFRFVLICLGLITYLSACSTNALPAPLAVVPANVKPGELYIAPQPQLTVIDENSFTTEYTGSRVDATYDEQFTGLYSSFHVPLGKPFVGQLEIENMLATPRHYAIICLVDYLQTPCNPGTQPALIEVMDARSVTQIPLNLVMDTNGLHDLEVIIVSDPYQNVSEEELHTLTEIINLPTMVNIYVGDTAVAPSIDSSNPIPKPYLPEAGNPEFIANKLAEFMEPRGIPVWLNEKIRPGKYFDFYLHFHNQHGFQRTNAVMAFINYKQAPIFVNGNAHTPLYLARRPGTWQSLHVMMQAPAEPGEYDLLLSVRTHAYTQLEGLFSQWQFLFDQPYTYVQLVKLTVEP